MKHCFFISLGKSREKLHGGFLGLNGVCSPTFLDFMYYICLSVFKFYFGCSLDCFGVFNFCWTVGHPEPHISVMKGYLNMLNNSKDEKHHHIITKTSIPKIEGGEMKEVWSCGDMV